MKYRIKQKGDKFYPQKKCFLFWSGFNGEPYRYWSYMLDEWSVGYHDLYFDSFEEANNFIINEKHDNTIIYHKI